MKVEFYRYGKHDNIVSCLLKKITLVKKYQTAGYLTTAKYEIEVLSGHVLAGFTGDIDIGGKGLSEHIIFLMYKKSQEVME